MKQKSIVELSNGIFQLEAKYNMLYTYIQNVPVWQSMRAEVFYKLAQDLGIYSTPHTRLKKNELIRSIPKVILNSIFNNPLLSSKKVDSFVFLHQRKVLIDNKYIDIYTKYFLDSIKDKNYEMLEYSFKGKNIKKTAKNHKFLDALTVRRMIQPKFTYSDFTKEEREHIETLRSAFEAEFGVTYDFAAMFARRIEKYKNEYKYYDKLFKRRRPKVIYLVVSYSHHALIAAAKDNNIKTVELQHGTISRYHLGYNYPHCTKAIKCFPDELYVFGDYWKDAADYPIAKDKITAIGFKYFQNKISSYTKITKDEKQILFISQGVIGKGLSEYALSLAKELPEYKIVYKLHPGEFARWKEEYAALEEASKLPNVKIVDTNEKTLYHYFAESDYQVGVFSTAIYEGIAFKCKTVLVELPGIEYMDDLVSKNIVHLVKNNEELKNAVLNFNDKGFNEISNTALFG